MYILIGILTYFLFSMILHSQTSLTDLLSFYRDPKTPNSLFFLISPDLYFAKQGKYTLENKYDTEETLFIPEVFKIRPSREYKAKAITSWNSRNLYFSTISFIIISLIIYNFEFNIDFIYFFTTFFTYRAISRSSEIGIAFFYDITDSKIKNPFLNSNKRIKLASKSYIEIIFNFATLNFLGTFLYQYLNSKFEFLKSIFEIIGDNTPQLIFDISDNTIELTSNSIIKDNPIDIFLKSFGITTFTNATVTSLSGIIQIITTLILVLFALAGYLNNKGDNK